MSQAQGGATKQVDLSQVSVPRLVFALLHQRFTGTLALAQAGQNQPRRVWFRGGMPVFTDWHEPTQMLGQILISQGLLAEADLYPALGQASGSGQMLGRCLLAMGRIDRAQLTAALRDQCARKLANLFPLRAGTVQVTSAEHDLGQGDELTTLNVLELIQASVGIHYDEARVADEMGAALAGRMRATAALQKYAAHFRFRPSDREILQELVAGTNLAGLGAMPGVTRKRAAQIVYTLWACQMLHVGAAAADVPAPPSRPPRKRAKTYSSITDPGQTRPDVATPPPSRPDLTAASRAAKAAGFTPIGQHPTGTRPDLSMASAAAKAAGFDPIHAGGTGTRPDLTAVSAAAKEAGYRKITPPGGTRPDLDDASAAARQAAGSDAAPQTRKRHATVPSVAAGDPATETEFVAEIERFEKLLEENAHAFTLFGLELDAGKRDVRRAWGDLSRKFHPDALKAKGLAHLRERVSAVFAALSEAQQVLADADQRAQLKQKVETGSFGKSEVDESAKVRAAFEADLIAREADKLLKNHAYTRALERFREANALSPDEPDTMAAIIWCEFQISSRTSDDAVRANAALDELIGQWPNTARAHYFRGFALMELGHNPLAIEAFRQAHALDPRMIDAERQARALAARAQAAATPKARRGGLRGLFGKK